VKWDEERDPQNAGRATTIDRIDIASSNRRVRSENGLTKDGTGLGPRGRIRRSVELGRRLECAVRDGPSPALTLRSNAGVGQHSWEQPAARGRMGQPASAKQGEARDGPPTPLVRSGSLLITPRFALHARHPEGLWRGTASSSEVGSNVEGPRESDLDRNES